jgi:hypothetical protein
METNFNLQSFAENKKSYKRPMILQELLLETKAGSVIPPLSWPPAGGEPIIPSGDFPINNEP